MYVQSKSLLVQWMSPGYCRSVPKSCFTICSYFAESLLGFTLLRISVYVMIYNHTIRCHSGENELCPFQPGSRRWASLDMNGFTCESSVTSVYTRHLVFIKIRSIQKNVHILLVLLSGCKFMRETTNLNLSDFESYNLYALLHFYICKYRAVLKLLRFIPSTAFSRCPYPKIIEEIWSLDQKHILIRVP